MANYVNSRYQLLYQKNYLEGDFFYKSFELKVGLRHEKREEKNYTVGENAGGKDSEGEVKDGY